MVRRASFRTRHLLCISAAKSRDHCMYHGSSSAACSGGNITPSSERTPWSTPAVSTRVLAAGDAVVVPGELLVDVHAALECGSVHVVTAVSLHFCEGCGVFESTRRLSQGVVGPSAGLEEFEEPGGE